MNNMCDMPSLGDNIGCVLGIGTDICSISRITKLYQRFKDKFLVRIFSNAECVAFSAVPELKKMSFLTKRFAAKEAIAKALGTGIGEFSRFRDITCISQKNRPPLLTLTGVTHDTALRLAHLRGAEFYQIHLSLSDDTDYASAFTLLTGTILTGVNKE